jgi:hypothetical protein
MRSKKQKPGAVAGGRASGSMQSGRTARSQPNPDRLTFQPDGADHPRCGGAARNGAERDDPSIAEHRNGFDVTASVRDDQRDPPRPSPAEVRARHAEIERRYDRRQPVRPEKPDAATWNNILPIKRKNELDVLRGLLAEAGEPTAEIDAVIADGGAPELDAHKIHTLYGFAFLFLHYKDMAQVAGTSNARKDVPMG